MKKPRMVRLLTGFLFTACLALPLHLEAVGGPLTTEPGSMRLELVEQWPGGLEVDLTLQGVAARTVTLHQQEFHQLSIPGAGRLAEEGRPELPAIGRYVAIPAGARVDLEIIQGEELRIPAPNLVPMPHQPPIIDDRPGRTELTSAEPDPAVYGGSAIYPARRVELETPHDIRGCRVALLKFYPVRYDPAGKALLYTQRLRVRLLFRGGNGTFIDPRHRTLAHEKLFRALLLNAESLGPLPDTMGQEPLPACEMLIITSDIEAFEEQARRLAAWKNQRGIPTQVVTTAETNTSAGDITKWISNRYHTDWPRLSYLLLFGDVDQEVDGENTISIPCHYRTYHPEDEIDVGTDLYYGVMGKGDPDYFPDLFIGRISFDTADEAEIVVDKIIGYEQSPDDTEGWLESILLAAFYQGGRYFIDTSEEIHNHLASQGYDCNTQYEYTEKDPLKEEVISAINAGVQLVTHRDHGQDHNAGDGATGWLHPEFTDADIHRLENGSKLPVMLSVNCYSGWFDGETDGHGAQAHESFCEELLRHENGGVVGVIGDTRSSYGGYNDELLKGFIDAIWSEFEPDYPTPHHVNPLLSTPLYQMGAVLNFGKYWMYDKYILTGGVAYEEGLEDWEPPSDLRNRIHFEIYHYHGDPSMEIWTDTPVNDLQVIYNPAFIGDTTFMVTQMNLDGALVAVSQNGVLLGRALSSGGVAEVGFAEPLDQFDELTLCVTKHNHLPWIETVHVQAPAGPWVLYDSHQVDDSASGNGDGLVSPGETVGLYLSLGNFGNTMAENVEVTLTSLDGLVDVPPGVINFTSIDPDETVTTPPLGIQVFGHCPDGALARFKVSASAGSATWNSEFFIEVNGAHLVHYSHHVLDNIPGNGNQNNSADPGEKFDLRVSMRNSGQVYASQVTAELTAPGVQIVNNYTEFPNIASGQIGTSNSPHFQLQLDGSIECGTVIPCTMVVSTLEGETTTGFDLLVGQRVSKLADDMEQGPGNWTSVIVSGNEETLDWSIIDYQPGGTSNRGWFSPGEEEEVNPEFIKDNWLFSPPVILTSDATLSFRHRVVMEPWRDGCVLAISTDEGNSWTDLGSRITHGGYTHQIIDTEGSPIGGDWAWSGTTSPGMTRVVADLSDFANEEGEEQAAYLRFRLVCDRAGVPSYSGWLIDDLEILSVDCNTWMTPDDTIRMESTDMVCTPVSGTLPFNLSVIGTVRNNTNFARLVAATLDLELAGGYYMADLTHGDKVLPANGEFKWGINRIFPGHPMLVGVNKFHLWAMDVSGGVYNQPPYPSSGDTAMGSCTIEGSIP